MDDLKLCDPQEDVTSFRPFAEYEDEEASLVTMIVKNTAELVFECYSENDMKQMFDSPFYTREGERILYKLFHTQQIVDDTLKRFYDVGFRKFSLISPRQQEVMGENRVVSSVTPIKIINGNNIPVPQNELPVLPAPMLYENQEEEEEEEGIEELFQQDTQIMMNTISSEELTNIQKYELLQGILPDMWRANIPLQYIENIVQRAIDVNFPTYLLLRIAINDINEDFSFYELLGYLIDYGCVPTPEQMDAAIESDDEDLIRQLSPTVAHIMDDTFQGEMKFITAREAGIAICFAFANANSNIIERIIQTAGNNIIIPEPENGAIIPNLINSDAPNIIELIRLVGQLPILVKPNNITTCLVEGKYGVLAYLIRFVISSPDRYRDFEFPPNILATLVNMICENGYPMAELNNISDRKRLAYKILESVLKFGTRDGGQSIYSALKCSDLQTLELLLKYGIRTDRPIEIDVPVLTSGDIELDLPEFPLISLLSRYRQPYKEK